MFIGHVLYVVGSVCRYAATCCMSNLPILLFCFVFLFLRLITTPAFLVVVRESIRRRYHSGVPRGMWQENVKAVLCVAEITACT